jgi:hypothetical protein
MLSLTYFSTSTRHLGKDELLDLLGTIRPRNEALGLTGMLLYADGNFTQTLEGPTDVVEETFVKISGDRRHRGVFVALREEIPHRFFPEWAMGFREISGEESQSVPGFTDYLKAKQSPRQVGASRSEVFHRAFRQFVP